MAAAPAATATRSTKAQERAARAERARQDGRRRTTKNLTAVQDQIETPKPAVKPARKPRAAAKPRAKKIVMVTDTAEAQAARALANLKAAEAKRPQNVPAVRASTTLAPSRTRKASPTPAADLDQHEFDLDKALEKLDERYLQCRDFGHSWRPFSANWSEQYQSYSSQLRCDRCTTVRTRWLTRTGAMMGGGYDYSEGYLVKGMGRLTGSDRDKVRLRSILNVLKPTVVD